jgi:hypothetical protein
MSHKITSQYNVYPRVFDDHGETDNSMNSIIFPHAAVLLQAWSGPGGSRKLRFPEFKTTAQGGGKVVSLMH